MDIILEHGLSVGAGVFLIGMMLYGHYRGFLRQCVSLGALLLTVIVVKFAAPQVTSFIQDNPTVRQNAANVILEAAGWEAPAAEEIQLPSAQRTAIERMDLPQTLKDILLENNNNEIYQMLGVQEFTEYVSAYLADILINVLVTIFFVYCVIYPDSFPHQMAGSCSASPHHFRLESYCRSCGRFAGRSADPLDCGFCIEPLLRNAHRANARSTGLCKPMAYISLPV